MTLEEIHKSPQWKTNRKAFLDDRGWVCEWCGAGPKNLSIHHPYRRSYVDPEIYLDFYLSQCIILCKRCHTATENGMELCEYEGGKYHTDGKNHYRPHDAVMCTVCHEALHPEIKEAREIKKAQQRKKRREKERKARQKYKNQLKNQVVHAKNSEKSPKKKSSLNSGIYKGEA